MKKIFIISALLFGLIGCETDPVEERNTNLKNQTQRANLVFNEIIYVKDNRTNLCFAAWDLRSNWGVLTNVPCTPEVEKLIK